MINVIFPIVATSFVDDVENFHYPLPIVEIEGKSLIEYSLESFNVFGENIKFIFVINENDCVKYHFDNTLKLLKPKCEIIKVNGRTSGAVCSVLMAIDLIDLNEELLIVNYDQYLEFDVCKVLEEFRNSKCDGGILTFNSVHPRWSYARTYQGNVFETAEKNPISNSAMAGFYYFKNAQIFIESAFEVIRHDNNYNGKYYTSSVYNQMILKNLLVKNINIKKEDYHSFYSSQKVKEFETYLKNNGKI